MLNRRQFFRAAALGGTGLILRRRAFAFSQSPPLTKFIQSLPALGPSGIPVASPVKHGNADSYRITMRQFSQKVHPNLPATTFWGYADATNGSPVNRYLGPAIVAQRGTPVNITYVNELPNVHPLPVDMTLPGAEAGQR